MRHLRSILYALVLAPAIWVLAGVGFTHDLVSRGRDLFTAESLSGLLLLVFAGILHAIMAFTPISPAGPTLAGAAYLGVTYWAWTAPESYAGIWSPDVVKADFDLSRPGYGLAALLAVPLLCTALSARRWARYEPPVLPIIGEIGRFRGSAKVAGDSIAAERTTVLRTGQQVPPRQAAELTVAIPAQAASPSASADRTQLLRTPAAEPTAPLTHAEPTAVLAPAEPTAPLAPAPAATAAPATAAPATAAPAPAASVPAPAASVPAPAASVPATPAVAAPATAAPVPATAVSIPAAPAVAARSSDEEQTTVLGGPTSRTPEAPNSNKSGITANSAITANAGKSAAETPSNDADRTVAIPLQPAAGPTPASQKPGDEETEVLSAVALVTPPSEHTKIPTQRVK
ncbi:hypothetical protein [Actinoplanes awajinensis]|uniref:Uncharacterized protein n=1 Tax=Actinoplanes awajinensis subsp. mycoplanecinus TaxID=135947 RepID=A0A0X3UW23_9ACTN|nr:hypothetical protein [Actinoplanes awajinensis]KUL36701.1 hypothetical protein ADL15_12765 [Actinoplanes awajinensis subsp. mycoplanecinus]